MEHKINLKSNFPSPQRWVLLFENEVITFLPYVPNTTNKGFHKAWTSKGQPDSRDWQIKLYIPFQ
jgi:hypothetical protein